MPRDYIPGSSMYKPVGDYNVYDYFLMNTEQYGDYPCFQHNYRDHMRSEFVNDVNALSLYYKKTLGFAPGDVYTVFLPTSIEAMAIFMALNKLGVIVNFVHPLASPERLSEIMRFTKSKGLAISDRAFPVYAAAVAPKNVPVLLCNFETYGVPDKFSPKLSEASLETAEKLGCSVKAYNDAVKDFNGLSEEGIKNNSKSVALYMQGGGTTGKSRTIKLTNFALTSVIYMCGGINEKPSHPGIDTEIGCMPFFHAYGFCVGGLSSFVKATKMVFLPKFDADKFIELMKLNHVVQFNGVPSMFKKLYNHPDWDGPHLASMKIAFGGGDDVGQAFLDKFNSVFEKYKSTAELHQGYGLTECCAIVLTNPINMMKYNSLGCPLPGLTVEIWDENNSPVPNGTIGEIVISGPTLMEGYLTEDGPVDDGIFYDANGRAWVKSGDLAYKDDDNFFFFAGRKKRIVIISGYNVYPVDIEKVMKDIPFIRESCSVQGFDENGKKIIRLYAVLTPDATEAEETYKAFITQACTKVLPGFSVPRDIRFIKELPLTPVNKVDFMKMTQHNPSDPIFEG